MGRIRLLRHRKYALLKECRLLCILGMIVGLSYKHIKDKDLLKRVEKVMDHYLNDLENIQIEEEESFIRYLYDKDNQYLDINCQRCKNFIESREIVEEYLLEGKYVYQVEKKGTHYFYYHIKDSYDSSMIMEAIVYKQYYLYIRGSESLKQRIRELINECKF